MAQMELPGLWLMEIGCARPSQDSEELTSTNPDHLIALQSDLILENKARLPGNQNRLDCVDTQKPDLLQPWRFLNLLGSQETPKVGTEDRFHRRWCFDFQHPL